MKLRELLKHVGKEDLLEYGHETHRGLGMNGFTGVPEQLEPCQNKRSSAATVKDTCSGLCNAIQSRRTTPTCKNAARDRMDDKECEKPSREECELERRVKIRKENNPRRKKPKKKKGFFNKLLQK